MALWEFILCVYYYVHCHQELLLSVFIFFSLALLYRWPWRSLQDVTNGDQEKHVICSRACFTLTNLIWDQLPGRHVRPKDFKMATSISCHRVIPWNHQHLEMFWNKSMPWSLPIPQPKRHFAFAHPLRSAWVSSDILVTPLSESDRVVWDHTPFHAGLVFFERIICGVKSFVRDSVKYVLIASYMYVYILS